MSAIGLLTKPDRGAIWDYFQVYLVAPNREDRYLLPSFSNLTVSGVKHGGGDGTLSFHARRHPLVEDLVAVEGFAYSVDVYYNDMTTPLFSGTVRAFEQATEEPSWATVISLQLEAIDQHLLRRRLMLSYANATMDSFNIPADNLALTVARWATGLVTPVGYPVGFSRSNFGPAGWALQIAALHAPGAGPVVSFSEESGNNAADILYQVIEGNGMGLDIVETSPRTWLMDVRTEFTKTDHSDLWRLSDVDGTLKSVRRTVDYSALANVFQMRGAGKEGAQAYFWVGHEGSYDLYGAFEDSATKSLVDSSLALFHAAEYELFKAALPVTTWDLAIRDKPGSVMVFNGVDGYKMCDRIAFETYRLPAPWSRPEGLIDPATPAGTAPPEPLLVVQDIVGYTLDAAGYQEPNVRLTLGKPRRNLLWELKQLAGGKGGRSSADYHRPNHGG